MRLLHPGFTFFRCAGRFGRSVCRRTPSGYSRSECRLFSPPGSRRIRRVSARWRRAALENRPLRRLSATLQFHSGATAFRFPGISLTCDHMKHMRRFCTTLLLAAGLCFTAGAAEVFVTVAPPHAVVEKRPARPGREYVWVNGYHNWDGHAHVWVAGAVGSNRLIRIRYGLPIDGNTVRAATSWLKVTGSKAVFRSHRLKSVPPGTGFSL